MENENTMYGVWDTIFEHSLLFISEALHRAIQNKFEKCELPMFYKCIIGNIWFPKFVKPYFE